MNQHSRTCRVCPWWVGYALINPLRRLVQNPEAIVAPYVTAGMTVLEIGPGMGFFSLALARLVGNVGRVICTDVQERMLKTLKGRAARAGLAQRMDFVVASEDSLHLERYGETVDFAFAFAVVHEVPDHAGLFTQIHRAVRTGGLLLVSEPRGHVSPDDFRKTIELAVEKGFTLMSTPEIRYSHSGLLKKT